MGTFCRGSEKRNGKKRREEKRERSVDSSEYRLELEFVSFGQFTSVCLVGSNHVRSCVGNRNLQEAMNS